MITPDWANREFLSSTVMNAAASAVSGSFAQAMSGISQPGLIYPETVGYTVSGLNVTVTAPLPFQIMFGTGALSAASGVTTGLGSSTYVVPFSGVVPVSGSTTAYLLASYVSIMEGPYQVIGPPPGHPDYDPTFAPFTAYSTINDSIALTASITAPNNTTTFELFRTTLASAATGVGALDYSHQFRAASQKASEIQLVSGVVAATSAMAGQTLVFTASGIFNLPAAAAWNGLGLKIASQTPASVSFAASGTDLIYGNRLAVGATSVSIPQDSFAAIESQNGQWQIIAGSPNYIVANITLDTMQFAWMLGLIA